MSCNLSRAITAAVVENEQLKQLLAEKPELLAQLMKAYLKSKYPNTQVNAYVAYGGRVDVSIGERDFTLSGGVAIDDDGIGGEIFEEVKKGLALAADRILAEKLASSLKSRAAYVDVTTKSRQKEKAYLIPVTVSGVQMRVLVLRGGHVEIFADTGTFEQAKQATLKVLGGLQAEGIPVKQVSAVEQHRTGGLAHSHVNTHTHKH